MNCLCGGLSIGTKVSAMDAAGLDAEVEALARVNSTVIARRSLVIAELARSHGDVAERLRNSGNMSSRQARKASKTASGLDRLPKTRKALERGEIGAEQAEQMASRMDKPELARNVRDNEEALLEKAKAQNADDFARTMRQEDIDGSPDGGKTHEQRQCQARKASMWVDNDTGMHHLFAQFDPVTGARISTQLAAMAKRRPVNQASTSTQTGPATIRSRPTAPGPPRRRIPVDTVGATQPPTRRPGMATKHDPARHQEPDPLQFQRRPPLRRTPFRRRRTRPS